MNYFKRIELENKERFIHVFTGISVNVLEEKVIQNLLSQGYKKLNIKSDYVTFEKGNRVMRILFGAFVHYFKLNLKVYANSNEEIFVEIKKATTGMSGGLIGMNQVKKELNKINKSIQHIV